MSTVQQMVETHPQSPQVDRDALVACIGRRARVHFCDKHSTPASSR